MFVWLFGNMKEGFNIRQRVRKEDFRKRRDNLENTRDHRATDLGKGLPAI